MAITHRGDPKGAYIASKSATVAWPTGAAVGDLAILYLSENSSGSPASKPTAAGWQLKESGYAETTWAKILTAADIAAGGVPVVGYLYLLQLFVGAAGVGRVSETNGVTVGAGGAAVLIGWAGASPMTPAAEKLHAADVLNPAYSNRPNQVWFRASETAGFVSWATSAKHKVALELVPLAAPPAPLPSSPATGTHVDPAVSVPVTWAHQSTRAQSEHRLRLREVDTSPWYWVTAAGALTLTDTGVASQVQSASIAAGALTIGKTYEWQVATADGGALSAYSASWQLVAVPPPDVTAITVTSVADDLTPTVAWTATFGVGSQEAYQMRLATSASDSTVGLVYDSGVTSGADVSVEVPAQDWANGVAQYAWVRVRQSGGLWSPWTCDDVTHAVSWTPPAAPTITATAGTPPTVVVSGVASGDVVHLQASVAGVWRDVATVTATGATATVYDPLATYGVVTTYRARRQALVSSAMMWSNWSTSKTLTNTDLGAYLFGDDGTWLAVRLLEDGARTIVQGVAVSYGLDATRPRIDVAPRQGMAGQLVLAPVSQSDWLALLAWLDGRLVWTVRWGADKLASDGTLTEVPSTRMGPAGPLAVARLRQSNIQLRTVTLDWVEQ